MRLADAKRLKPGDVIVCGTATRTADNARVFEGVVRHVTVKGGIRISARDAKTKRAMQWPEWVPYSHVIRKSLDG